MRAAPPIPAVPDHVAVVVAPHAWDIADQRWRAGYGGCCVWEADTSLFRARQHIFSGHRRLEVLTTPSSGHTTFVRRFLDRFGPGVQHITLKVPDLASALQAVGRAGITPVDVSYDRPHWHEAFISPRDTGGPVVQLARTPPELDRRRRRRHPGPPGPELVGVVVDHPDLDAAATMWRLLGADVTPIDRSLLECSWGAEPLKVWIGARAAVRPALVFSGVPPTADVDGEPPVVALERLGSHDTPHPAHESRGPIGETVER